MWDWWGNSPALVKDCSIISFAIKCYVWNCYSHRVWSSVQYWPVLLVGCNHCLQEVPPWNGKGILQSKTYPACGRWLWVYETEPRCLWCHHYWFIWSCWWEEFLYNCISPLKNIMLWNKVVAYSKFLIDTKPKENKAQTDHLVQQLHTQIQQPAEHVCPLGIYCFFTMSQHILSHVSLKRTSQRTI